MLAWLVGVALSIGLANGVAEQPDMAPRLPAEEPLKLPALLGSVLSGSDAAADVPSQFFLEPVARPIDSIALTPWKAPAFDTATQPGFVVRRNQKLPWGLEAEWRVGVAAHQKAGGGGEFADASIWSVKTAVGDRFFVYLHDKGTGFVKYLGDSVSVYGRVITGGDRRSSAPLLQVGAARSF